MGEKAKHGVDEARGAAKDATVRVKEAVVGKVTTPGPPLVACCIFAKQLRTTKFKFARDLSDTKDQNQNYTPKNPNISLTFFFSPLVSVLDR